MAKTKGGSRSKATVKARGKVTTGGPTITTANLGKLNKHLNAAMKIINASK